MAYRIEYGPPIRQEKRERFPLRLPMLTCLSFAAFLFAVKLFWPAGQEALTRLLLPLQGAGETQAAMAVFLSDLREGQSFREALTTFCRQIVSYADLPAA